MITLKQLEECHKLASEVEYLHEEIERLEELNMRVSPVYGTEVVQTSAVHDRMTARIVKIEKVKEVYEQALSRYLEIWLEAERAVSALPETVYRRVLRLRYIDGRKWRDVAQTAHYSEAQCYRYHDEALFALRQLGLLEDESK